MRLECGLDFGEAMAAANVAMATSFVSSFLGLKTMDGVPGSLQQAMAVELEGMVKVQKRRASREQRVRIAGMRSMAPELVEMEPPSQGSQLLGDNLFHCIIIGFFSVHCRTILL